MAVVRSSVCWFVGCLAVVAIAACGGGGDAAPDAPTPQYTVSVTLAGNAPGIVRSTPAGIDCGGDCSEAFDVGNAITLTAIPNPGVRFVGWTGGCVGAAPTCTVTVYAAVSVTAMFALDQYTLTVVTAGNGAGTITSAD